MAIGLPKEQYKPRPSRSRGNPEEVLLSLESERKPKKETKVKPARKAAKSKRISDSDAEDSVIESDREAVDWVQNGVSKDENNDAISDAKLNDADENGTSGKPLEAKDTPNLTEIEVDEKDTHKPETSRDHPPTFTIEVPPPPQPQPKKRGRKKKQKPIEAPIIDDDEELKGEEASSHAEPQNEMEEELRRQPLQAKDPNAGNPTSAAVQLDVDERQDSADGKAKTLDPASPAQPSEERRVETPKKQISAPPSTDSGAKGPTRHSPIGGGKVPHRVGLSRRAQIQPLLKVVRK